VNSEMSNDEIKEFAEKIWQIRKDAHMTRKQVCKKFGISERTIQSWEIGERLPPQYVFEWYRSAMKEPEKKDYDLTEMERQELLQAINNQIDVYSIINPSTDRQGQEIEDSVAALKSAKEKIFGGS